MDLPLDVLRECALRRLAEPGAAPVFVTLSGAHLYGFASPDSDFDVRGCHLLPVRSVVSLFAARETIEFSGTEGERQIDFVSHDAAKFFRLMLNRNGYVMEQVFSPLVVVGGADLDELRDIARGCITRGLYHYYCGFFANQLRLLEREEEKRVKTLLYVFRVLLTGIHALKSGEIEANLPRLLDLYPQGAGIPELIAAKVKEKATLAEEEIAPHRKAIDKLRKELDEAYAQTTLGEIPRRAPDLDAFLVRLRLRAR